MKINPQEMSRLKINSLWVQIFVMTTPLSFTSPLLLVIFAINGQVNAYRVFLCIQSPSGEWIYLYDQKIKTERGVSFHPLWMDLGTLIIVMTNNESGVLGGRRNNFTSQLEISLFPRSSENKAEPQ